VKSSRFSPQRREDLRAALHRGEKEGKLSPRRKLNPPDLKGDANQKTRRGLPSGTDGKDISGLSYKTFQHL
jgi:hypothetical protein